MADYSSFIVIWLAVFWSTDGPFADSKGNNKRTNIKTRFRRNNEECQRDYNKNGYAVLNKSEMDVKFLINNHKHFARLKWNPPTVKKNVPVTAFVVCWKGQQINHKCKCVSNKTLELDIWPSESNWKYDNILNVCVSTRIKHFINNFFTYVT
ncbi:uncharacterized protein LOC114524942 [Dendronephthya gigantea]|uniref:uncharacterized protein LOC114524942 n=1 Tax=Dendronephthya gigantea TaxID=151771 RepID=UPI00106BF629|nr:uncharacterized protein LOC114524942 [Dendronephthya gigantea]